MVQNIFWNIPITEYWKPQEGVLKKQIKIISNTHEEYVEYKQKLEKEKDQLVEIIIKINNKFQSINSKFLPVFFKSANACLTVAPRIARS